MDCREYSESYLSADADGELTAAERRAAAEHLGRCASCAARLESERQLKALLLRRLRPTATPPEVRARIVAALDQAPPRPLVAWIGKFRWPLLSLPLAIAAAMLFLVIYSSRSQAPASIAFDQASVAFARFESRFVPDVPVGSAQALETAYRQWLGVSVHPWNFDKLGYRLVGGRTESLPDGGHVTYTLYHGAGGDILCSFFKDGAELRFPPGGFEVRPAQRAYRYHGFSICLTLDARNMVCILTSKMPLPELARVIDRAQQ